MGERGGMMVIIWVGSGLVYLGAVHRVKRKEILKNRSVKRNEKLGTCDSLATVCLPDQVFIPSTPQRYLWEELLVMVYGSLRSE